MADRKCEKCNAAILWSGVGRPPRYCFDHRRNKKRDQKKLEERAARNHAEPKFSSDFEKDLRAGRNATKRDGTLRAELASTANRARRLAFGLALESDVELAAKSVGLDVDAETLAELAAEARSRHKELIKLDTGAIGRLLLASIGQAAVRLFETVSTIAPSQIPGTIKSAAQALELLQGDTDPVLSDLKMVFQIGEMGEEWNPNTLLPQILLTKSKPSKTAEQSLTPVTSAST